MQGAMRVACKDGDKVVGFYEINSLPGCPQVAVSNQAFIGPQYRKQGYGTRYHEQRLKEMKELGYNYVICTVNADNTPQLAILKKFDWKELSRFKNVQTSHDVILFGKHL